jgi:hypothetical protein
MNGNEYLTGLVNQLKPLADQREANNKLRSARERFKKVIERLLTTEVERITILAEEAERYSAREWDKLISEIEWAAKRLTEVADRMKELRPLTEIDDPPADKIEIEKQRRRTGKLSGNEISEIKRLINGGERSLDEIAAEFDISPGQVSAIKNERVWPLVEPRIAGRVGAV